MQGFLHIAVIGAGPAGLALALQAARCLPQARIALFDARPAGQDLTRDPRTLALSLGSVQLLQRLGAWPADVAQPIAQVHVSQAPPSWSALGREAAVRITAQDEAVPMLGAVLGYGQVVAPLQAAWEAAVQREPQRLQMRFGTPVAALKPLPDGAGVEVDAGIAEPFDLAVVAEGGVFAEQARKAVSRDYHQAAWVGEVSMEGLAPGLAIERFTAHGPLALLPLKPVAGASGRAAMVWCVPDAGDPVAALDERQRLALLATLLPPEAGRIVALGPLKRFALGLNAERTLVDGATVRIGNAAQTLHPVAGQGLNLGLRDAFALVQGLQHRGGIGPDATSAEHATALRQALRSVEWGRAPDRWATIATTDLLARGFTWRGPGLAAARGLALALLQATPPLRHALARQMMFGLR